MKIFTRKKTMALYFVPQQIVLLILLLFAGYQLRDWGGNHEINAAAGTNGFVIEHGRLQLEFDDHGRMLRQMGLLTRQYNAVDYEAHWDSFGLEERAGNLNPGDWAEVDERLYIPRDLGLNWVAIDSGWDNGTGSCVPNEEIYANEAEFIDWIDDLHGQGFNLSLWFDPGFGDELLVAAHLVHPKGGPKLF
jgi:hypothetical protein